MVRILARSLLPALLFLAAVPPTAAQEFPTRPVRLIVPNPAGGPTDWLARAIGAVLEKRFPQPVVVENRSGAGGYTGAEYVSRSDPDGYTVLIGGSGMVTYPVFLKDNRVDPVRSFTHLSVLMETPWIIVVNGNVPAKTLGEFLAYARANPGRLNMATVTNSAQQMDIVRFTKQAGVDVTLVNYGGTAPVYAALLANEVQAYFGAYSQIAPHAKTGRLVPLAIAAGRRLSLMPSVPTAKEAGFDYEAATAWFGAFAPAGVPAAIAARLATEIAAAVKGELAGKVRDLGYEPVGSAPEALVRQITRELGIYTEMAKVIGIKPQ